MEHFEHGVNLGGWLSQYARYDHKHFRSFIRRPDIDQIAAWGMDHVRLPVDYPVLESDAAPGVYREDGFQYIDACLEWCRANGLGVVLDLHHAPGYTFTNTLQPETQHLNTLFTQEDAQQRFIALWQTIARRYHTAGLPLVLELLNEVVLPDSAPWNQLARRTVEAIRQVDPVTWIMIGGNHYNAASELKNIAVLDDPNICYTFHFYEPLLFTHQKAPWTQVAREFNQTLDYPGVFTNLKAFIASNPEWEAAYAWQAGRRNDADLLREFLSPALEFIQKTGKPTYCGEFGVISGAPAESRRRWHADFLDLLRANHIGWSVWSYKQMDFGLVDGRGEVVDAELVRQVSR